MRGMVIVLGIIVAFIFSFCPDVSADLNDKVLFINVKGNFDYESTIIYWTLETGVGADATYVQLENDGDQVASLNLSNYDQIWVFDLSLDDDDDVNYQTDWQAIANWFQDDSSRVIICDARMLASYSYDDGGWLDEGQLLTENYYENMASRGGGLLLATDDYYFQPGINEINSRIGIEPFFELIEEDEPIPVDTCHPLMNTPNDMGVELFNDTTPGQTPYGLQDNGRILYTVAWHSDNPDTPGISTTIEGCINFHVDITSPLSGSTFIFGEPVTFIATPENGDPPYTYEWSSNLDSQLGSGDTRTVSTLSVGIHQITVLAEDNEGRDDDDTIEIEITPCTDYDHDGCCDTSDNCPATPNCPNRGTCTVGDPCKVLDLCNSNEECGVFEGTCVSSECTSGNIGELCGTDDDCDVLGFCSMNQEDTDEDGLGDACDFCEGDFTCDLDVDGSDAATFKADYGRSQYLNPCTIETLCFGDFDCDEDVDGTDAATFIADFGRSENHPNPCPPCETGMCCVYE